MDEDVVIAAFLTRYWDDRVHGRELSLTAYQQRFPGYEQIIARELSAFAAPGTGRMPAPGPMAPSVILRGVGPYRITAEIARGGQGEVYLAEDTRLHRPVALKILRDLGQFSGDRLRRFQREAELASRLDHPGICTVHDSGIQDGVPYIAMRFVDGESLAQRVSRVRAPSTSAGAGSPPQPSCPVDRARVLESARIVEQAARALHAAHEAGVIHRDIKPGNIMVTPDGQPVVLDFGLAANTAEDGPAITRSGDLLGTPAYMSPEQLLAGRAPVDRRTDVWSLGVTLYELLTLERPFDAPTHQGIYRAIQSTTPPDPRRFNRAIPADLSIVVLTALAQERDRRYRTAQALADDLQAVREGRPIAARPVSAVGRLTRWSRREPAKALLALMLVLGLPVVAALVTSYLANREKIEAANQAARERERDELLAEGFDLLGWWSYESALRALERALALDAGCVEAVAGIAMAQMRMKRFAEALGTLDLHSQQIGHRRVGVMLRIDALRGLGREDDAGRLVRILSEPRDAVDHLVMGSRLLDEGHTRRKATFAEALEACTAAVLLCGAPRAVYFCRLVEAAGDARNIPTLRMAAAVIRARWSDSPRCHFHVGYGFQACDLFDEGIAALHTCLRLDPAFANARALLGTALYRKGLLGDATLLDDAIAELKAALTLEAAAQRRSPELQAECHCTIALALNAKGLREAAVVEFREALHLAPDNANTHRNLGLALGDCDRPDEALAENQAAVRLQPGDTDVRNDFGIALNRLGRHDQAIAQFELAVQIDPDNADALCNLGVALARRNPSDEKAVSFCNRAVQLAPRDIRYRSGLARVLAARSDFAGFDSFLLDLPESSGPTPEDARRRADLAVLHYNLGSLLQDRGRLQEALARYRDAIGLAPDYAEAWCNQGYVLGLLGQFRESFEALRQGDELGRRNPHWKFPSAEWVARARRLVQVERRILEAIAEDTLLDCHDDLDEILLVLRARGLHLAAARLLEARMGAETDPPESPRPALHARAARSASLVGTGQGHDASSLTDADRAGWRRKAWTWLAEDLANTRIELESGAAPAANVRAKLVEWIGESDLGAVREESALAALPEEERREWQGFWTDVRRLLATLKP